MLEKLAEGAIRRPRVTCILALALLLAGGIVGSTAPNVLKARNDFQNPASGSATAQRRLERAFHAEPITGVLVLVQAPPTSAVSKAVAKKLEHEHKVAFVARFVETLNPSLFGRPGSATLLGVSLRTSAQPQETVLQIERQFKGNRKVLLGGSDVWLQQVNQQSSEDLGFAEILVFPLLALLAFVFFRGIAVLLPLSVGVVTVLSTFAVLVIVNQVLSLSIFALNLVFGLGLGLSIDYSLFLVSRFREELGSGASVADAVRTTMTTAGRTVLLSAVTVACASASLLVFPLRFLQSMGVGGAVVALLAAAVSLSVLPAIFVLLGPRIGRHVPGPVREGAWYRIAHTAMRRPGVVVVVTAALLLVIAIPSLRVHWSGVNASLLPPSKSARVVSDRISADFPHLEVSPMVLAIDAPQRAGTQISAYARTVSEVAGVIDVSAPTYAGHGVWEVSARTPGSAIAQPALQALSRVRDLPAPYPVAIGGETAEFADMKSAIGSNLAKALGILVATTLLILWIMTGSVVLPIKTLIMDALTVGVATGTLVWIFQDGRLEGLLSYTTQGGIEPADFLVLVAIAFALSTDYGVFLLTRIKEARDSGIGDREAIAVGLQRSGKIVTAASVLLAVAIGAFVTAKLVFLKQLGVGAAVGVLVDAFVVRTLLVPSLMAVLGRWNWWQPQVLHRLSNRLGLGGHTSREENRGMTAGGDDMAAAAARN
jgi:uncharacterized membrane protein YdfJ with MMPL/SSD domain